MRVKVIYIHKLNNNNKNKENKITNKIIFELCDYQKDK